MVRIKYQFKQTLSVLTLIKHLHSPHCPLYISYGTDEILIGNQELLKFVVQSASPRLDILNNNNNNKQPFKSGHVE